MIANHQVNMWQIFGYAHEQGLRGTQYGAKEFYGYF